MSNKSISVYSKALEQQTKPVASVAKRETKAKSQPTSTRDSIRDNPRAQSRDNSRAYPTRDEVQEFSFTLRDELKVKVQAEVPHTWQKELDDVARDLDVKKLELYRFILGEFLGKVKRKSSEQQVLLE